MTPSGGSVAVRAAALRHIATWRPMAEGSLAAAIDQAVSPGPRMLTLSRDDVQQLFAIDFKVYGYGTKRALRSDREDCALCAELGRAIEAIKPMAARS